MITLASLWLYRACADERYDTVRGELTAVFRRYGLPEQILSDNGPPWGTPGAASGQTRLTLWMLRVGVRVIHGRPRHPQTQGKAERFHRTLVAELLSRQDLRDLREAQRSFDGWRDMYNLERPSEALGHATPASRYRPSQRVYPERLPALLFGPDDLVRRVRRDGTVNYASRRWYVSMALAGEHVGLRPSQRDGEILVCYGPHPIGRVSMRSTNEVENALR